MNKQLLKVSQLPEVFQSIKLMLYVVLLYFHTFLYYATYHITWQFDLPLRRCKTELENQQFLWKCIFGKTSNLEFESVCNVGYFSNELNVSTFKYRKWMIRIVL